MAVAVDAVRILVLGPVELWVGERRAALGGPKQRTMLALLANKPFRVKWPVRLGLLLPCNVCVWEDEGGSVVSLIRAESMFGWAKAEALGRRGIVVDKHKIELDAPIKSLGTYKVAVKVFPGMTPEVTVVVEPKG